MNKRALLALATLTATLASCSAIDLSRDIPTPQVQTFVIVPPTTTALFPITPTLATNTPAPTATSLFTPTPVLEDTTTPPPPATPMGCGTRPPDLYARIPLREWTLNQRTMAMLDYAQALYQGPNDFMLAITQGSYNSDVEASFGTHNNGGAIDISIYNQGIQAGILTDQQIEHTIQVLRAAGFAAWYRALGDLYAGSPLHIHAIAIGDAQLSPAASQQLVGPSGYFRGRNGLPDERSAPDRHGGPLICPWMIEMGYTDLTASE